VRNNISRIPVVLSGSVHVVLGPTQHCSTKSPSGSLAICAVAVGLGMRPGIFVKRIVSDSAKRDRPIDVEPAPSARVITPR
jgi:hypothetical protein